MLVSSRNLADYLMEIGLIDGTVVANGLTIVNATSRSRNFKVLFGSGGFFVKQIASWTLQSMQLLAREALCYRLANDDKRFDSLTDLMPRLVHHDPDRHILILDLLPNAENLAEHHARLGTFAVDTAASLGRALGTFHRDLAASSAVPLAEVRDLPRQPPWILSLNLSLHAHPSPATNELVRLILDYPEFAMKLTGLAQGWRTDVLIHGDMKWQNCVLYRVDDASLKLCIVDWELADIGDARWDVGGIFQAYLSFWALALRTAPGASAEAIAASGPYALDAMQPAMHAFWTSYANELALDAAAAAQELAGSLRYAAARIVQTAYELSAQADVLSAEAIRLLQIGFNMLDRPHDASRDLFGFTP